MGCYFACVLRLERISSKERLFKQSNPSFHVAFPVNSQVAKTIYTLGHTRMENFIMYCFCEMRIFHCFILLLLPSLPSPSVDSNI